MITEPKHSTWMETLTIRTDSPPLDDATRHTLHTVNWSNICLRIHGLSAKQYGPHHRRWWIHWLQVTRIKSERTLGEPEQTIVQSVINQIKGSTKVELNPGQGRWEISIGPAHGNLDDTICGSSRSVSWQVVHVRLADVQVNGQSLTIQMRRIKPAGRFERHTERAYKGMIDLLKNVGVLCE